MIMIMIDVFLNMKKPHSSIRHSRMQWESAHPIPKRCSEPPARSVLPPTEATIAGSTPARTCTLSSPSAKTADDAHHDEIANETVKHDASSASSASSDCGDT